MILIIAFFSIIFELYYKAQIKFNFQGFNIQNNI